MEAIFILGAICLIYPISLLALEDYGKNYRLAPLCLFLPAKIKKAIRRRQFGYIFEKDVGVLGSKRVKPCLPLIVDMAIEDGQIFHVVEAGEKLKKLNIQLYPQKMINAYLKTVGKRDVWGLAKIATLADDPAVNAEIARILLMDCYDDDDKGKVFTRILHTGNIELAHAFFRFIERSVAWEHLQDLHDAGVDCFDFFQYNQDTLTGGYTDFSEHVNQIIEVYGQDYVVAQLVRNNQPGLLVKLGIN